MITFLRSTIIGRQALALALFLLFSLNLAGPIKANSIAPGQGGSPDVFPGCAGCTLMTDLNTLPVTSSDGLSTFDLLSATYSDPSNPFGAGDLDFMYQVSNSANSAGSISAVAVMDFTGFQTDVGFTAAGASLPGFDGFHFFVDDGTVAPGSVDRSPGGVGFSFIAPFLVAPGETSNVLIIKTNSTHETVGTATIFDGGATTVDSLEPIGPASSVPEPASALLLGTGLLSMAFIHGFRRSLN